MFAVEKVSGITAVEREWFESRERSELGGCPLPSIAYHAVHAERTAPVRKSFHGHRIPARKIEIAECCVRGLFTPGVGIGSPISDRGGIGRAFPLGFGRQ